MKIYTVYTQGFKFTQLKTESSVKNFDRENVDLASAREDSTKVFSILSGDYYFVGGTASFVTDCANFKANIEFRKSFYIGRTV